MLKYCKIVNSAALHKLSTSLTAFYLTTVIIRDGPSMVLTIFSHFRNRIYSNLYFLKGVRLLGFEFFGAILLFWPGWFLSLCPKNPYWKKASVRKARVCWSRDGTFTEHLRLKYFWHPLAFGFYDQKKMRSPKQTTPGQNDCISQCPLAHAMFE